jgi:hypothetical protein
MDLVYICRAGENEELRYSIRSAEKNLKFNNLWVVGAAPSWYTGNLIEVPQIGQKYAVARKNLKTIVSSNRIDNDFVLMNDDFFVMKPMDKVEPWHGGKLATKLNFRRQKAPNSAYTNLLYETYNVLKRSRIAEPLDYELHTPLPMTREGLGDVLSYGGLWRSLYSNFNQVGGEEHLDVKIYSSDTPIANMDLDVENSPYLSTDDGSFPKLRDTLLSQSFSEPSSFES